MADPPARSHSAPSGSDKFDLLVTNGTVLTLDAENRTLRGGAVAVSGGRIAAVGPAADFADAAADRAIDADGGLILPGLVNVHTHAAMTLFRGLADDLPLMTWLQDHIFPAEARLNADRVYDGALLACAEMIRSGTTCFCDMYLFEESVARAARDAGMRAAVGEVLYDFPSPNYGPIEAGFDYVAAMMDRWADDPLIRVAVEPHSPYLCAPSLLERAAELARSRNARLVIHLSETRDEVQQTREKYGRTPVEHLAALGVLGPDVVAPHCVHLTEGDIALLAEHDVKAAHNPESNMKLASGVAPVPELLRAGVRVGLGTDGCASNNDLDLLREMDTCAKLHKVNTLDPTVLDARTVLRMATIDAARCLGLEAEIGSLEAGKRADLIVVDRNRPHLRPMYNPESHLVYAVRGSDVAATVVNGRVLMADRRLETLDQAEVMARAAEAAEAVAGRE
ncbi:MAG: amidohydrolase [Desulfococcaceae bacterium]